MKIWTTFDGDGRRITSYPEDVYRPSAPDGNGEGGARHPAVPGDAVQLTPEQWQDLVDHPDQRRWNGAEIVHFDQPPPPVTVDQVKIEANRRILAIMPAYKQNNALAFAAETMMQYGADPADWPPERQAMQAEATAAWTAIKAIRTRSDEIEAMNPIPADYADDDYWPAA